MAKVVQVTPNSITLRYRQEEGDDDYGACLWADFLFNLDEYQLNINSDCGSYAYGWDTSPSEPFLKLMVRINAGYLLGKIAKEDCVDVDATRVHLDSLLRNEICDETLSESSAGYLMSRWEEELSYHRAPAETVGALLNYIEDDGSNGLDWESIDGAVVADYSAGAKKIVEIFKGFIQPKIRELLEVKDNA